MERQRLFSRRDFLKLGSLAPALHPAFGRPRSMLEVESSGFSSGGIEGKSFWRNGVIGSLKTESPIYALTIDDGWFPDSLEAMLDLMSSRNMQATFFFTGLAAWHCDQQKPGIIKRVVDEGHSIGYHSMKHPKKQVIVDADLKWWRKDFDNWWHLMRYNLLGVEHANKGLKYYARAPYGEFTDPFMELCERASLQAFAWSKTSGNIENGQPMSQGDILLLHVQPRDLEVMRGGLPTGKETLHASSIECFEDETKCQNVESSQERQIDIDWDRLQRLLRHRPRGRYLSY